MLSAVLLHAPCIQNLYWEKSEFGVNMIKIIAQQFLAALYEKQISFVFDKQNKKFGRVYHKETYIFIKKMLTT